VQDDANQGSFSSRSDEPLPHLPQPDPVFDARQGRYTLDEVTDFELIRPCDIRGVLHSHSHYTDGVHDLQSMVETARSIGLEYLGISDHYRSNHHRDGLDIDAVARQRREIEELSSRFPDFDILQGVEIDANADGTLPLSDADLLIFDYVIASLPECTSCSDLEWTDRALRLLEHPLVSILGKPVGGFMLHSGPVPMDMKQVLAAAAVSNTAVEIDANPLTAQLNWDHCHLAQEAGVYLVINPNAHRAARLVDYRHGAELAREAGVCCRSILNTLPSRDVRRFLRRTH
jgi:DNA polymerase (family 10)